MKVGITVGAELLSACLLIVVLYTVVFENPEKSLKSRLFAVGTAVGIFACVFDAIAYAADILTCNTYLLYVANTLAIVTAMALTTVFIFYLFAYIRENVEISWTIPKIILIFTLFCFVLCIIGISTGQIFYIQDGVYVEGERYFYVGSSSIISLIIMLVVAIKYRKDIGSHDFWAIVTYIIIPIFAKLLELIIPGVGLVYSFTSLSILLLYFLLQSKQFSEMELREKILTEISKVDMMTGIGNRRAYMEDVVSRNGNDHTAVVFCDINGLKYTNDTYGHAAGDDLIVKFSGILKEHFGSDSIYRISGDEFVIIVSGDSVDSLCSKIKKFEEATNIMDRIASVGYALGESGDCAKLVKEAELFMYDAKRKYYELEGSHKR